MHGAYETGSLSFLFFGALAQNPVGSWHLHISKQRSLHAGVRRACSTFRYDLKCCTCANNTCQLYLAESKAGAYRHSHADLQEKTTTILRGVTARLWLRRVIVGGDRLRRLTVIQCVPVKTRHRPGIVLARPCLRRAPCGKP